MVVAVLVVDAFFIVFQRQNHLKMDKMAETAEMVEKLENQVFSWP